MLYWCSEASRDDNEEKSVGVGLQTGTHFLYVFGGTGMGRREVEDRLFSEFEPLVRSLGAELLDVEILTENRGTVLRAVIHRPQGVTLDDCADVQRTLSSRLDETDPILGTYTLEVSSPGLERSLRRDKEFEVFKGMECQANVFAPVTGKRTFRGELMGLEKDGAGETVVLKTSEGLVRLKRANVSKVKLLYDEKRDL